MDAETIPFQVNLGYQVPRTKVGDYPVGYLTSPWYSPELETNIAMAYVPIALSALGTALRVRPPDRYAHTPGEPVEAEVVDMPFRESVNQNTRERLRQQGLDAAV
jgi:glycine cleavage system aminomethyltransferase T